MDDKDGRILHNILFVTLWCHSAMWNIIYYKKRSVLMKVLLCYDTWILYTEIAIQSIFCLFAFVCDIVTLCCTFAMRDIIYDEKTCFIIQPATNHQSNHPGNFQPAHTRRLQLFSNHPACRTRKNNSFNTHFLKQHKPWWTTNITRFFSNR